MCVNGGVSEWVCGERDVCVSACVSEKMWVWVCVDV